MLIFCVISLHTHTHSLSLSLFLSLYKLINLKKKQCRKNRSNRGKHTIYMTAKIPGTLIKHGGAKLVAHLEWDIIHA